MKERRLQARLAAVDACLTGPLSEGPVSTAVDSRPGPARPTVGTTIVGVEVGSERPASNRRLHRQSTSAKHGVSRPPCLASLPLFRRSYEELRRATFFFQSITSYVSEECPSVSTVENTYFWTIPAMHRWTWQIAAFYRSVKRNRPGRDTNSRQMGGNPLPLGPERCFSVAWKGLMHRSMIRRNRIFFCLLQAPHPRCKEATRGLLSSSFTVPRNECP